ncbi:tryptophan synthase subunit alpha [Actinophytocola sp.]|uniref:tryptophan synthase subunit alpha n=1 Tax=Actinophytocola sp. TaxID=1872138 RepID=UPI003D6AF858
MADAFFTGRRPGLAMFLNAGDPPLPVLRDVVLALDEQRVDCLELAVPFPNSFTDGPVVRRSATRALANGADLDSTLRFVGSVASELRHLKIVLLADWSHTVKPRPMSWFLDRVAAEPVDGVLLHGLPPRLRDEYYDDAAERAVPVVTTCYPNSASEVVAEAADRAGAYVYLVARYGRSGTRSEQDFTELRGTVAALRETSPAPIAVGFGVRDRHDVAAIGELGADAAVIGSAAVTRVEHALDERLDPVTALTTFADELTRP